jgi:hypothetical protein
MPWGVEREGSTLRVHILPPMEGEWEPLTDELQRQLDPKPVAVYIPSYIVGGTQEDADMLKTVWSSLRDAGIVILPPT